MVLDFGPVSFTVQVDDSRGFALVFWFHIYSCNDEMIMVAYSRTCSTAEDGLWVGGKEKFKNTLLSCSLMVHLLKVEIMCYF